MKNKIAELFDVSGVAAIVTGGASGIGFGLAEALVANGARVTIFDINPEGLSQALESLRPLGEVRTERVDISDGASIQAAVERSVKAHGGLDVAFANAGVAGGSGFLSFTGQRVPESQIENADLTDWDRVIATNLTGVMLTAKAVVPAMKKRGGGRIIVTTSTAAFSVAGGVASLSYYPAKAGAAHLVKRLALELARFNILVNAIAPGAVSTNIAGGVMKDPTIVENFAHAIPVHRFGQPADFHGVALFLSSAASSYITGTEFVVDGGLTLGGAD